MDSKRSVKGYIFAIIITSIIVIFASISFAGNGPSTAAELQAAIDASVEFEEIDLAGNIVADSAIEIIDKDVLISGTYQDGDHYTVSRAVYDDVYGEVMVISGGSVELKDLSVIGTVRVESGATLIIHENTTVINNSPDSVAVDINGSTVKLEGGSIKGGKYGIRMAGNSNVNARNGSIHGYMLAVKDDDGTCSLTIDPKGNVEISRDYVPESDEVMSLILKENTTGERIYLPLEPGVSTYNIDIPEDATDEGSSYSIAPDANNEENAVTDVTVNDMYINGSSSSGYNEREVHFNSEFGSIVLKLDVEIYHSSITEPETRTYTVNLFQPRFKGLTVTPDIITSTNIMGITHVGTTESDFSFNKCVFYGADTVRLTLPDSMNNQVKGFTVTGVDGDGASFAMNDANDYTVTLSSNFTSYTLVHINIELPDGETEEKVLAIDEMAVSQNMRMDEAGNFSDYAYYHTHPDFPIEDPHMVIVYYRDNHVYEEGEKRVMYDDKIILRTETKELPNHDVEVLLAEGNIDDEGPEVPNMIAAFIVSGDVDIDETEFGGVAYAAYEGSAFSEEKYFMDVLPNHPLVREIFKDGGKK